MTLEQMLAMVGKMFPNANLKSVFQQAQKMVQGTPDTLQGVSSVARNVGIDKKSINDIFNRFGNTAQAKMLCAILGTTPEALKHDAESIVGEDSRPAKQTGKQRFPRLK